MLQRLIADRSMRAKMLLVVGVLTLVAAGVGALSISRMAQLNDHAGEVYDSGLIPLERIGQVEAVMFATRINVLNHAASNAPASKAKYEQALTVDDAAFTTALDLYATNTVVPQRVE